MATMRGEMSSCEEHEVAPNIRQVWSNAQVASGEWRAELVVPSDPMELRGEALLLTFVEGAGVEKGLRFPVDTHNEISVEVINHVNVSADAGVNVSLVWDVVIGTHGFSAHRFTASRFESAEAAQQLASAIMRALGAGTGKLIVASEKSCAEQLCAAGGASLSGSEERLSSSDGTLPSGRPLTRDPVTVLKLCIALCVLILCGLIYITERKSVGQAPTSYPDYPQQIRPPAPVYPGVMGRLEDLPAPVHENESR